MQNYDYVIVGAGISGLTLAYQLSSAGKKVLVIERNKRVGGLAKSFTYSYKKHKFNFDIGPKRFHTDDQEVLEFIHKVLSRQLITIGRVSGVYFLGNYFNWPISFRDIPKLPLTIQMGVAGDILGKIIRPDKPSEPKNFKDAIVTKYGNTLYRVFFAGYTEKFIRIPPITVHADWATTGINRSIIDPKAKGSNLWELIQSTLIPKAVDTKFLYPKKLGFGFFTETLAGSIRNFKSDILTDSRVTKIDYQHRTLAVNQKNAIKFKHLVWTGNLIDLAKLLNTEFSDLGYLSTVFFNILIKGKAKRPDQWIYFADPDISFVRVTIPQNIARYATHRGYTSVILERTCFEGDAFWQNPKAIIPRLKKDLVKTKLIENEKQIIGIQIQKIADTYPVYNLGYKKGFAKASLFVHSRYPEIRLLGRSGTFWYNNSDHSIKAALGMAKYFLGQTDVLLDNENIFSDASLKK